MDGGLLLTSGLAHIVGDAAVWAKIMRLWAQHTAEACRGEQSDIEELQYHEMRNQLSEGICCNPGNPGHL